MIVEGAFCSACGTKMEQLSNELKIDEPKNKICPKCGIKSEGQFCSVCGTELVPYYSPSNTNFTSPVVQPNTQIPPIIINNINKNENSTSSESAGSNKVVTSSKNRWLAFVFCLFLGFWGIHRFYVGKIGTGLLWFFTCGICGLGWLVDLVVILFGGFRDANGNFLK